MYKPLPNGLTIKQSTVDGLGLFTTKEFRKATVLGISHIRNEHFEQGFIRTPLGAFYNHTSNEDIANCKTIEGYWYDIFVLYLITTKSLNVDEEILVQYTMYELI